MADWQTISSLATAGGTLVLAVATFSAVRSSSRSTRIAEEALRSGMRPLLVPSTVDDPVQKLLWGDLYATKLPGGRALADHVGDVVYLAIGLRNLGSGIAVLNSWYAWPGRAMANEDPHPLEEFRRLALDLYIAPGHPGYWESAVRESDDPFRGVEAAVDAREPFTIDLLYGDLYGGQRTISRFFLVPLGDDGWYPQAVRHWHLDGPAPR